MLGTGSDAAERSRNESVTSAAAQRVDQVCAAHVLVRHPFLAAWTSGTPSRDALRSFATQYYRFVDALPRMVGQTYAAAAGAPAIRRELIGIMSAEDHTRPAAGDLWLRVCASLGLFSDTVRRAPADSSTAEMVDGLLDVARNPVSGLGGLLALTLQQPALARQQRAALATEYELGASPVREFYERMEYSGIEHAARLRHALSIAAVGEDDHADAERGATEALQLVTAWFDALGSDLL